MGSQRLAREERTGLEWTVVVDGCELGAASDTSFPDDHDMSKRRLDGFSSMRRSSRTDSGEMVGHSVYKEGISNEIIRMETEREHGRERQRGWAVIAAGQEMILKWLVFFVTKATTPTSQAVGNSSVAASRGPSGFKRP